MLYVDTSAFLKRLVAEEHSEELRAALDDRPAVSSSLLGVEAHRAGRRLGLAPDSIDDALTAVSLVFPSETTFATARTVAPETLRTLDALHLATALKLGGDLEALVTYDRRLALGSDAAGVEVLAPGRAAAWWID